MDRNVIYSQTIYNLLVKPQFKYLSIAWGNSNCEGMKRLKLKHKQAIRNVANAKYNSHVDPLLAKLELLNFEDALKCHIADFVKHMFLDKTPPSFKQIFKPMSSHRVVKLANQRPKIKALELFPSTIFPKIWN